MKEDTDLGRKIAQSLEKSSESLSPKAVQRLATMREQALLVQKLGVAEVLAANGKSGSVALSLLGGEGSHRRRYLLATLALLTGLVTAFYWQQVNETVDEMEEIDSALLADDLPPDAYLDKGFSAWLSRSQDSSVQ
jgi:hypothetical protein